MVSTDSISQSFPPVTSAHAHTLILGTMPGRKSLEEQQYYAHPRNALWPILCAIATDEAPRYSIHQELSYQERCELISEAGYALWDVLDSCVRPGSLDNNIIRHSELPNPILQFIDSHRHLHTIIFNGRTAHTLFKRHLLANLTDIKQKTICLPSTSPAMASLTLAEKFALWREATKVSY